MCLNSRFIDFFLTFDAGEFPHFVWTGWDKYRILHHVTRKQYCDIVHNCAYIVNSLTIIYAYWGDHTLQERWDEYVDSLTTCFCILSPNSNNFWFRTLRLQKETCFNSSAFGRKITTYPFWLDCIGMKRDLSTQKPTQNQLFLVPAPIQRWDPHSLFVATRYWHYIVTYSQYRFTFAGSTPISQILGSAGAPNSASGSREDQLQWGDLSFFYCLFRLFFKRQHFWRERTWKRLIYEHLLFHCISDMFPMYF